MLTRTTITADTTDHITDHDAELLQEWIDDALHILVNDVLSERIRKRYGVRLTWTVE